MGRTKDFFNDMREGEQFANLFVDMDTLHYIRNNFEQEEQYRLNSIKQKNSEHKEDKLLCELYKEQTKINIKVREREQELNHKNK